MKEPNEKQKTDELSLRTFLRQSVCNVDYTNRWNVMSLACPKFICKSSEMSKGTIMALMIFNGICHIPDGWPQSSDKK